MTLSDYERRVLEDFEAEFAADRRGFAVIRRAVFRWWPVAAAVLAATGVCLLAIFVGVIAAAPFGMACAVAGAYYGIRVRQRHRLVHRMITWAPRWRSYPQDW